MSIDIDSEQAQIIRRLIPLATLPSAQFARLCKQLVVEQKQHGEVLFRRGDEQSDLIYLLNGSINLCTESFKIQTIESGTDSARFAIAHQIPRKIDALAEGRVQFLRLKSDLLRSIQGMPYEESESTMMVEEFEDCDDWMTTLLRSPVFRALPPANLQKIMIGLEEVYFKAGDVIIRQGDPGDYYYIIKKGQVLISRRPYPNAKEIKLLQLGDSDTFGEDALISGSPRNVSITAITDICLLRLSKDEFIALIKQPTLKYIEVDELPGYLRNGAELIDVRGPDEFQSGHLSGSINVPFFSLRMYIKTMNRHHPIVVVCGDGRTSESAAFVLQRNKFNALILRGGLDKLPQEQLKSEQALFNIDDGTETSNLTESAETPASKMLFALEDNTVAELTEAVEPDLQVVVQQLRERCMLLEAEKATLQLKCTSLSRQLKLAKAELGRFKEGGS